MQRKRFSIEKAIVATLAIACLNFPVAMAQQGEEGEERERIRRLDDALTMDPGQEWDPNSQTEEDPATALARKLLVAERALAAGALVTPPMGNALYYFQEALQIDPSNDEAAMGIGRVADALVARARAAQAAGDKDLALSTIEMVKSFRANYPGLRTLEEELTVNEELDALVALAASQEQSNRLTLPAGDNALESYRELDAMDPGNAIAREGIARIEAALIATARNEIEAGDYGSALATLSRAEQIREGDSAAIATLRDDVSGRQESERIAALALVVDEAESLVAQGNLAAARQRLDDAVAQGFADDARIAAARAEIARIERIRAFPAGSNIRDSLSSGGSAPTMVVIPAGEFEMGSPRNERSRFDNEGPQKTIRFTIPFALAEAEVTVGQFRQFVDATGYSSDSERNGESTIYNVLAGQLKEESGVDWTNDFQGQRADDDDPVVHVSWNDAKAYADWLTEQTGEDYRLPTESEFEYAVRGGSTTPYWWGRGTPDDQVENLTGERDRMAGRWEWPDPFDNYRDGHWGPAPAKSFETNGFGLYDMGGNVMEWTNDCYSGQLDSVPADGATNTSGNCNHRVLKGGAWANPPSSSRSATRASAQTDKTTCLVGFRVARSL